jgi:exopolysaccharide production protein ExoQ
MTGKSSTYFNGAGGIVGLLPGVQPQGGGSPAAAGAERITWRVFLAGSAAACSALALVALPKSWMWESIRLLCVGIFLLFVLVYASRLSDGRSKPAFFLWWLVLVSECIFWRTGDETANAVAFEGQFPTAAYGEVLSCVLCLVAVIFLWAPARRHLGRLFTGDYKWLTLFAVVVVASCAYSPRPAYSLAWSIKLCLTTLLVVLCSTQVCDFRDTVTFLRFTFWGYALVVLVPVVLGLLSGSPFDDDGRMSPIVSPNQLGPDAGAVFLLALTLYSRVRDEGLRRSAILIGAGAFVVMILAGSKTGILGALFAGTLFFVVRGRVGSAFSYVGTAALLLFVLALSTPLGSYFTHYAESGDAESFSGRTFLWGAVMPAIRHKLILGHGYLASTFVEFQVNAVRWAAPHLHNGFIDVLYNNGLIGLVLITIVNVVIARNLIQVLRRAPSDGAIYRLAAGSLAIFAHLLINGFLNASFGGKARPPFMLLIGLILVSNKLLELASIPSENAVRNLKTEPVTSGDFVPGAPTLNTFG